MKTNIILRKIESNQLLNFDTTVDFEEFSDLFLSTIENKFRIKSSKKNTKFNYKEFHKKEKERIEKLNLEKNNNSILILKSPPLKKKGTKNTSHNSSKNTSHNSSSKKSTKISEDVIENNVVTRNSFLKESFVNNSIYQKPIVFKSLTHSKTEIDDFYTTTPVNNNQENSISTKTSFLTSLPVSIQSKNSNKIPIAIQKSISSFISSVVSDSESDKILHKNFESINSKNLNKIITPVNKNTTKSSISSSFSTSSISSDSIATVSEDDQKRELLFKLQFLANKNPELVSKYPFTMRSDLKVMKNTYLMILKQIKVNNKVDNLNTYLIAGFMLCEYFLGKMGFDMEGFSKQQIASMKNYENLLIEMGEKEYTPYGMNKWSVEIRLCMTLVFNAFWFIVAKSISKKTNFDILELINFKENKDKEVVGTPKMKGPPQT